MVRMIGYVPGYDTLFLSIEPSESHAAFNSRLDSVREIIVLSTLATPPLADVHAHLWEGPKVSIIWHGPN